MPSELPALSGKAVITALKKAGFRQVRTRGSHHIMKKEGHRYLVTVPVHGADVLARGTLLAIIRATGLTTDASSALL